MERLLSSLGKSDLRGAVGEARAASSLGETCANQRQQVRTCRIKRRNIVISHFEEFSHLVAQLGHLIPRYLDSCLREQFAGQLRVEGSGHGQHRQVLGKRSSVGYYLESSIVHQVSLVRKFGILDSVRAGQELLSRLQGVVSVTFVEIPLCWRDMWEWRELRDWAEQ